MNALTGWAKYNGVTEIQISKEFEAVLIWEQRTDLDLLPVSEAGSRQSAFDDEEIVLTLNDE